MGIVSHIIRYCFTPCGSGSHLYTANTNTLRSVHRNKDLLALVGTHLSWSPCPPLLCLNYITNLAICQGLFRKKLLAVRLERTSSLCRLNRRHQPQMGELDSNEWGGTPGESPQPKHTICVLYPYCITTWAICQGVFYIFFDDWNLHRLFLRVVSCVRPKSLPIRERCSLSPLDTISIPQTAHKVKNFFKFFQLAYANRARAKKRAVKRPPFSFPLLWLVPCGEPPHWSSLHFGI